MKAKFTEQQPAVFWQPVEKKIFVTICLNETETEEEMGETKQTVYEYDCNQIWIQEGELDEETVRASPEKYLDYIPQKEKTPTELLEEKIEEQQTQIQMLTDCLLEMSETVYR